jgi:hypothetical protein
MVLEVAYVVLPTVQNVFNAFPNDSRMEEADYFVVVPS